MWLARGVTGALRAVKVVWREDFEDERGFEREFEGILKFEPISRDHPALVNILHVGRSPDGVSFYYYVMELGDDVRTGRDINPIEYEPRTLRADHHQATGVPWAYRGLHRRGVAARRGACIICTSGGLAHRDVKPSNMIFVNGKAKLADIGLVAARGQRTFVGTEGFVPPEGPGSAQADVYSLGKVLYEIATGKDRMNFPELPDEMPTGSDRKRWLELNRIICDVCEPRISKRKITTAAELAEALRRIQRGKRRRRSGTAVLLTTLVLAGFACWAGWEVVKDTAWAKHWTAMLLAPEADRRASCGFSVPRKGRTCSMPTGCWSAPRRHRTMTARVGEEVVFTLRKNGYQSVRSPRADDARRDERTDGVVRTIAGLFAAQAWGGLGGSSGEFLSTGRRPPCRRAICDQGAVVAVCRGHQAGGFSAWKSSSYPTTGTRRRSCSPRPLPQMPSVGGCAPAGSRRVISPRITRCGRCGT